MCVVGGMLFFFGGVFAPLFFVISKARSDKFSIHNYTPNVRLRVKDEEYLYKII